MCESNQQVKNATDSTDSTDIIGSMVDRDFSFL
jgi:hypothetical protein